VSDKGREDDMGTDDATKKLTVAQRNLLDRIAAAGYAGMVVPGTLGACARVLRSAGLVSYVDEKESPPRQRATEAGLVKHARRT
jgi:hypothetical protein